MSTSSAWDKIVGNWKQIQGDARTRWGKLTDDDIEQIAGQREKLAGKLQERYGIAKDDVNKQIDDWANKLKL